MSFDDNDISKWITRVGLAAVLYGSYIVFDNQPADKSFLGTEHIAALVATKNASMAKIAMLAAPFIGFSAWKKYSEVGQSDTDKMVNGLTMLCSLYLTYGLSIVYCDPGIMKLKNAAE